jgi:hypothetical protein
VHALLEALLLALFASTLIAAAAAVLARLVRQARASHHA